VNLFVLLAALVTSTIGVLAGLGGSVLLVPLLVFAGWSVAEAAPLALLTVAAASIASGARHLARRTVNHRLGVATGLAAGGGAIVGATVSSLIPQRPLLWILAVASVGAGILGSKKRAVRNPVMPELESEDVGERVGKLSGVYANRQGVAFYEVRGVALGLPLMSLIGVLAGASGVSGGFLMTPVTSELMNVPTRVASTTTTFTLGVTSAAALVVYAVAGRIPVAAASAAILGSVIGGRLGAGLQPTLPIRVVRRGLSAVLFIVAVGLVVIS
jgi:uncharacterized membrane protein YfcA